MIGLILKLGSVEGVALVDSIVFVDRLWVPFACKGERFGGGIFKNANRHRGEHHDWLRNIIINMKFGLF